MAVPLPMLAGHALLIAWYAPLGEALRGQDEARIVKLFEAGLSVPIRLRLSPDADQCQLVQLYFNESLLTAAAASGADSFWKFAEKIRQLSAFAKAVADNASVPKIIAVLRQYGLTFKGKVLNDCNVRALKVLMPFVGDAACGAAYSLMEAFCPELRESTLLMRIAQFSLGRVASTVMEREASARASQAAHSGGSVMGAHGVA